jgi:alkaline phosphatase D
MSSLRKPIVGPIVGHTTPTSCRLWIAAGDPVIKVKSSESRRTIGVLGVYNHDKKAVLPENVYYFRLKREYDRTGTFNLGQDVSLWHKDGVKGEPYKLKPDTKYTVRMSSLTLDDSIDNDLEVPSEYIAKRLPDPGVWASALTLRDELYTEANFKTAKEVKDNQKQSISFLLGSCRYPGMMWKRKEADRIFGPMVSMNDNVDFTLMVGDQIYADLYNRFVPVGLADTYEEFQERYRSAFSSPNMARLLSQVPTYMTLDDHEIEDNWTQDRIKKSDKRTLFNLAISFYMSYQWSHGPRFDDSYVHQRDMEGKDVHLKRQTTPKLYYNFKRSGYPFFVLDSRTQRYKNEDTDSALANFKENIKEWATGNSRLADNHMLGKPSLHEAEPNQLDYLCAWLRHMQEDYGNVPKFIVTSSVFAPNGVNSIKGDNEKEKSDSWDAFPNTRSAILKTIIDNKVQNVIFLSGDIHCANVAELEFSGEGEGLKSYCVTSSAFYWPFSFADGEPSSYVHDSKDHRTVDTFKISDEHGSMDYKAWGFTQEDNFAHLSVLPDSSELQVQLYGNKGQQLERVQKNGKTTNKPEKLKLAAW